MTIFTYAALRPILLGLLTLTLVGCSARPFPTTPSDSVQDELERTLAAGSAAAVWARPGARVVSICYSGTLNTPEEVWEEARLACPYGTLTYRESNMIWNGCALLQPVNANFICTPRSTRSVQN